jgi:SAM-dependent methyltransferase
MDDARGVPVPWWAKIATKIVLARLIPSYRARKALGIFRHGHIDRDFFGHSLWVPQAIDWHRQFGIGPARTVLELGPGDSVGTALFATAQGADRIWLIDVGDFATRDMAVYREIVDSLAASAPDLASRVDLSDRDRMLAGLNATYLTGGTGSFGEVPDGSVDLVMSSAVLEHVRRAEFATALAGMFRVLRPGGTGCHIIDLRDHLGGGLHNLRFSERVWEHPFLARSGFYTNRLRSHEIIAMMEAAGFEAAIVLITRWPELPVPREALAGQFSELPDEELRIADFAVLLRKPLAAG